MTKARRKKVRRKKAANAQSNSNTKVIAVIIIGVIILAGGIYALTRSTTSAPAVEQQPIDETGAITTASGLKYIDLVEGTGPSPQTGQMVTVHYIGTLTNGSKFESSVDQNKPIEFIIGIGKVIKGWDEGLMSMKVGGKRKLIVPPELGYENKRKGRIPPNSMLIFEVELLGIK